MSTHTKESDSYVTYFKELSAKLSETLTLRHYKVEISDWEYGALVSRCLVKIIDSPHGDLNAVDISAGLTFELGKDFGGKVRVIKVSNNIIYLEMPNRPSVRKLIYLKDALQSPEYKESEAKVPILIGEKIGGELIVVDLYRMSHLLIGGRTGAGKSVWVNSMICSLISRHSPEEVRFLMIDLKVMELQGYNNIPHMLAPVIHNVNDVIRALDWLVNEMKNRFQKFEEQNVINIGGFNKKIKNGEIAGESLPIIVCIIDELADLMMINPRRIEILLVRLAQLGKSAGIHLIVATNHPTPDVLSELMISNFPSRIAFKVTSPKESRLILNFPDAEYLVGWGDMLCLMPTDLNDTPVRALSYFISDEDVDILVSNISKNSKPKYNEQLLCALKKRGRIQSDYNADDAKSSE